MAVGDNRWASALAGLPVRRVLIITYVLSGLLAAVAGIAATARLTASDPSSIGNLYELSAITAVVVGGTSLSAPVVAAMYALAGGSGGTSYPASSLYTNRSYRSSSLYDVTLGGNGFCAGDDSSATNPNKVWNRPVDCSYPRSGNSTALPRLSPECNATPGFDGPSGVGAPKSMSAFYSTTARLSISHPATARSKHRVALGLGVTQRARDTRVVSLTWYFGDGAAPARGRSYHLHHTWKKAGRYTVTVRMYDSRHQYATTHATVRVR